MTGESTSEVAAPLPGALEFDSTWSLLMAFVTRDSWGGCGFCCCCGNSRAVVLAWGLDGAVVWVLVSGIEYS
jgi:hypothetical protein